MNLSCEELLLNILRGMAMIVAVAASLWMIFNAYPLAVGWGFDSTGTFLFVGFSIFIALVTILVAIDAAFWYFY